MSVYLRGVLFAASAFTCVYIIRKIRRAQVRVMDMFFWVGTSALLVAMSIFPSIAIRFADAFQFESPANFVFLAVISLLLLRCFLMSVRLSQLEGRVQALVEELAVREAGNQLAFGGEPENQ